MGAFWDAVGEKLAERWASLGAPALVFWTGSVLAWAFDGAGWSDLSKITDWFNDQDVAGEIAALLGALVVVGASATVVKQLTTPVLRLLEGYWPSWLRWLARRSRCRIEARRQGDEEAWQKFQIELDHQGRAGLSAGQVDELARLEQRRRHLPVANNELLPTRVGNVLRAAETRPWHRYGLEAVTVWPRLWLALPDPSRQELIGARATLDGSAAAVIWGLAFVVFTPLAWWAAPVGITVAVGAMRWWVPARAEVFADLVEASYDLHRASLYEQLRWPLPASPADEQHSGRALTRYLMYGSDAPEPKFTARE